MNPISGFPLDLLLYGIICSQQEWGPPWCLLLMGLELASDGGRLMLRGWKAAAPAARGETWDVRCHSLALIAPLPACPARLLRRLLSLVLWEMC